MARRFILPETTIAEVRDIERKLLAMLHASTTAPSSAPYDRSLARQLREQRAAAMRGLSPDEQHLVRGIACAEAALAEWRARAASLVVRCDGHLVKPEDLPAGDEIVDG